MLRNIERRTNTYLLKKKQTIKYPEGQKRKYKAPPLLITSKGTTKSLYEKFAERGKDTPGWYKKCFNQMVEAARFQLVKGHNRQKYSIHAFPDRTFKRGRVHLLGQTGRILGTAYDDFNSCDLIQNEMDAHTPDTLILGDIAHTDLPFFRLGSTASMLTPTIHDVRAQDTMARKKLNEFFMNDIGYSLNMHFAGDVNQGSKNQDRHQDLTVYETDDVLKRKIGLPQMTAARYICSMHNKKVFFGQPDPWLLIEEIAGRLSLQELENIFYSATQTYHDTQEGLGVDCVPAYKPIDLQKMLNAICRGEFHDEIYEPQSTYNASLLKKCLRLYKQSTILVEDERVEAVEKLALDPDLPEIEDIFERDYKTDPRNLGSFEETMDKLILLSHLHTSRIQEMLKGPQCHNLISQLWSGRFKNVPDLQAQYVKSHQKYSSVLRKIMIDDLTRLEHIHPSSRMFIEDYADMNQRFELKKKRDYRVIAHPLREQEEAIEIVQKLFQQVEINMQKRESLGIKQDTSRAIIKKITEFVATKEKLSDIRNNTVHPLMKRKKNKEPEAHEIDLWASLMLEANAQLGLVSLPEVLIHKYKGLIQSTQYEQFRQMLGEDPMLNFKKQLIRQQNIEARGIDVGGRDGSVPSFEEFTEIHQKILDNRGNSNQTPLARQLNVEDTQKNFEKLDKLMLIDKDNFKQHLSQQLNLPFDLLAPQQQKKIMNKVKEYQSETGEIMLDDQGKPVKLEQLQPNYMTAINLDHFGGQSALDVMQGSEEENKKAAQELLSFVPQSGQPILPPELVGKSVEQMKAMGAEEIGQMNFGTQQSWEGIQHKFKFDMTPEHEQELRDFQNEIETEHDDPDYFLDDLTEGRGFNRKGMNAKSQKSLNKMKQDKIMADLKKLERFQVLSVMKALEQGVRIKDSIYDEMIDEYPHYKRIRDDREKRISDLKTLMTMIKEKNAPEKEFEYAFEKFARSGRRNLTEKPFDPNEALPKRGPTIDTTSIPTSGDPEVLYEKYSKMLDDFDEEDELVQENFMKYADMERDLTSEGVKTFSEKYRFDKDGKEKDFYQLHIEEFIREGDREELRLEGKLGSKFLLKDKTSGKGLKQGGSLLPQINQRIAQRYGLDDL